MDIEQSHFGRIAEPTPNGGVGPVDIREVVHRLVLFDECIIESSGLAELPALVRAFGSDGVLQLIYSGALRFIGDVISIGQIGQTSTLEITAQQGLLPLGSYRLSGVTLAKGAHRADYINKSLEHVNLLRVRPQEASSLRLALRSRLEEYPESSLQSSLPESVEEIIRSGELLRDQIREVATKSLGTDPGPDFEVDSIRLGGEGDFRIVTDLQSRLAITPEQEHKVVERAVLGIAGFNQRIQLMSDLNALTGFREDERQLFEWKVVSIARELNAANREVNFSRVVTLGALERFAQGTEPPIDVKRLIKFRESSEVREFRAWLQTVGHLSDNEITEAFSERSKLVAARLGGPFGRTVRFVIAAAIGAISPVSGIGASAIDTFLIDKLAGRPGPAVFLGRSYPSVFK